MGMVRERRYQEKPKEVAHFFTSPSFQKHGRKLLTAWPQGGAAVRLKTPPSTK